MSSGDPARRSIDTTVLAWIRECHASDLWTEDEARFDQLACELFAFQFEHCDPYRRYCTGRSVSPDDVRHWSHIPPVPAGVFKEVELRSFPKPLEVKAFRTSGTSSSSGAGRTGGAIASQGTSHLDTLDIYEASLMASLDHMLLRGWEGMSTIRVLAPSAAEAAESSLSHMFATLVAERGNDASGFDVADGALCVEALGSALDEACARSAPVLLCGTAFAFVHWLEAGTRSFALPAGSRVMETGGFKGRARERSQAELYREIEVAFGVPEARTVNQYGMTELGSQFYDSVLVDQTGPRRKLVPPWVRVLIIDPETRAEVAEGDVGTVTIVDLTNTGSLCAIQTADLGRRIAVPGARGDEAAPAGFEILGREPGAEQRGCSIATDLMLGSPG